MSHTEYTIVATLRGTKIRVVIERGLTQSAAKLKAGNMPSWQKKRYKDFRAAKSQD